MSNTSSPSSSKEQEGEEVGVAAEPVQSLQLPAEGCAPPTVMPSASEGEPEPAPRAHCQAWLLDMLDDVRYLISCTNWY